MFRAWVALSAASACSVEAIFLPLSPEHSNPPLHPSAASLSLSSVWCVPRVSFLMLGLYCLGSGLGSVLDLDWFAALVSW